jgi:hypothetical protein
MKEKRKWLWEFSKKIVVTVTIIFVAVFIYSAILLWRYPDSTAVVSVIENASHIFEVTVVGYILKSAAENVLKIKDHYRDDMG